MKLEEIRLTTKEAASLSQACARLDHGLSVFSTQRVKPLDKPNISLSLCFPRATHGYLGVSSHLIDHGP